MPSSIDFKNEGSALDNLCKPSLYDLTSNISALQFEAMKLIPARHIVEQGIKDKQITNTTTIVESSSGTFAVALAIICAHYGFKLRLVTGPIGPIIRWRLEALGAEVDIVNATGGPGGIQQDRMNHLKKIMAKSDDIFWTQQHSNYLNPLAYENLLSENTEQFDGVDYLICSTGTGGSITGMSRKIREINPGVKVIGVDHNLSCLFGPISGSVSQLCTDSYHPLLGMGSDVVHPNLDHTVCDQVHWVPVNEMIFAAHELHNRYGVYIGPTGASTYRVAKHIVKTEPNKRVLCVFPDHGVRYADSIFNPEWLDSYGTDIDVDESKIPQEIDTTHDVAGEWVYMDWARRTYEEVHGFDCIPRTARA